MGVKVVAAGDILKYLDGLVHEPKQVAGRRVDLTVREVYVQETPGALDFGGSQYEEARRTAVEVVRDSPEDEHGWWLLDEGAYLLDYNESIKVPAGSIALVTVHPRAAVNGLSHPALVLVEKDPMPVVGFTVGVRGVRLKQNARISTLLLLD